MTNLATSIDVEQAFSTASQVISKRRNRLTDDNARMCIVLSSWLQNPAFSAEQEMKQRLVQMWKKEKEKVRANEELDDEELILLGLHKCVSSFIIVCILLTYGLQIDFYYAY